MTPKETYKCKLQGTAWGYTAWDAQYTAIHSLGLEHEDRVNPLSVMRQLTPDDVAGRNSIYGPSQAAPGGSPPPPSIATTGGGGGGGCSFIPGNPTHTSLLLAAL